MRVNQQSSVQEFHLVGVLRLSYLTLFLEMCYRHALSWLGLLFGFDLSRVKERELKISWGLWHQNNVTKQTAYFSIANVLRVLVSVSCHLLNQRKEVTQNIGKEHGKKRMFCRCVVSESDLSNAARHITAASLSTVKWPEGLLGLFSMAHGLFIMLFLL